MKYGPHPDAAKHSSQMVYRGRGRTGVDVVRSSVPAEAPPANPLPRIDPPAKAQPKPTERDK